MENYLKVYDSLDRKIVYDFRLGYGGIGDLTKFFVHLLNICIDQNIKIHYLINNIPAEKYLKLCHPKMYISAETILQKKYCIIIQPSEISFINNKDYYHIIQPFAFYDTFSFDNIKIPLQEVFYFTDAVKRNLILKNEKYISLHLRMGDKHLETDKQFVCCKEDSRTFYEDKISDFIEKNYDKRILFMCDNNSYKLRLKARYEKIVITDFDIGHTSFINTTDHQVLNTIKEFYLLSNSDEIYIASYSGFSRMASKFKNIPIHELY
jgi:hypothetical protein